MLGVRWESHSRLEVAHQERIQCHPRIPSWLHRIDACGGAFSTQHPTGPDQPSSSVAVAARPDRQVCRVSDRLIWPLHNWLHIPQSRQLYRPAWPATYTALFPVAPPQNTPTCCRPIRSLQDVVATTGSKIVDRWKRDLERFGTVVIRVSIQSRNEPLVVVIDFQYLCGTAVSHKNTRTTTQHEHRPSPVRSVRLVSNRSVCASLPDQKVAPAPHIEVGSIRRTEARVHDTNLFTVAGRFTRMFGSG